MGFCRGNARRLLELRPNHQFLAALFSLEKMPAKLFILQRGTAPLSFEIFRTSHASRMFSWIGRPGFDPPRPQQFPRLDVRSWRADRKDDQPGNPERKPAGQSAKSTARALPRKPPGPGSRLIYSLQRDLVGFGFHHSPETDLRRGVACQPQVNALCRTQFFARLEHRGCTIAKISKGDRRRHAE